MTASMIKVAFIAAVTLVTLSNFAEALVCGRTICPRNTQCGTYRCLGNKCIWNPKKSGTPCDDNNKCTVEDTCKGGFCIGKAKCPKSTSPCVINKCDKATGECSTEGAKDGTKCSDGFKCTSGDTCKAGKCQGTPVVCPSGPCILTNKCDEAAGGCVATIAADGTVCDDGKDCTWNTKCKKGNCVGDRIVCQAPPPKCKKNVCNPLTGKCDLVNVANGTPCNDGKRCTIKDQCTDGVCAGTPRTCDNKPCAIFACNEATGLCAPALPFIADGTSCDDGKKCTTGDTCKAGRCVGTPVACASTDPCVIKTCNPLTGQCDTKNAPDKTPCDDGLKCTVGDFCVAGKCRAGRAKRCPKDSLCASWKCEEPTGDCKKTDKPEGTTCDDGNKCTTGDQCKAGKCVGEAVTCPAGEGPCAPKVCNPRDGICTIKRLQNGAKCDDGLACTVGDSCRNGKCRGTPKSCRQTLNPCDKHVCVEPSGSCVLQFNNGLKCNNNDPCTVSDVCSNGKCLGTPKCVDKDTTDCLTQVCVRGTCRPALEPTTKTCTDASGAPGTCNTAGVCVATPKP